MFFRKPRLYRAFSVGGDPDVKYVWFDFRTSGDPMRAADRIAGRHGLAEVVTVRSLDYKPEDGPEEPPEDDGGKEAAARARCSMRSPPPGLVSPALQPSFAGCGQPSPSRVRLAGLPRATRSRLP